MNGTDTVDPAAPRRRFRKRWFVWPLLLWWSGVGVWNTVKPEPPGVNVHATADAGDIEFLYDLTYRTSQGLTVHEQQIFDEVMRIVDEADSFVVADFFLLNDLMGEDAGAHRRLSREFAGRLIARKAVNPALSVLLVTDPINDVYGGAPSELLARLREAGIQAAVTDLTRLRDPNPAYSAFWRMFVQWWGNSPDGGWLMNPFESDGPPITLRSWLALLNFKANHRKLIAADRADGTWVALVTSANPHDASSEHSNVALRFKGELARSIVASEMAVAGFSGWRGRVEAAGAQTHDAASRDAPPVASAEYASDTELAFITEAAVRDHLLQALAQTAHGDSICIAVFYLSDRRVVDALLAAATRGVNVKLILDPNRDAFGLEKDGVPNRPVANELVTRSEGRIDVRWYRTDGEQFHTKLALITHGDVLVASLGSSNFTRRNIGGYNLEANVAVRTHAGSPLAREMIGYFERLWRNEEGVEYTAPFDAWRDESRLRYWRYRVMEATGLSTF